MTSTTDRRLKQVEAALYPTEAMALWLQQARRDYRSLHELAADLHGKPDEAHPLFGLTRQVEAGARDRIKPLAASYRTKFPQQRREFIERGARDMVRDVATIWYLFLGVNQRYLAERRALTLLVGLLHAIHDEWLLLDKPTGPDAPRERIIAAVDEIAMWGQAVATLQERYFERVHPLMPDLEEHLAWLVGQGQLLVERFNDALEMEWAARRPTKTRTPALPKPIDLDAVQRAAAPSAEALVSVSVNLARAEAHEMMGEHRQAVATAERHL